MKKSSKVSIVIPVYNVEKYIDECLESCVKQTYENIEIICVNDGSPDNSVEHIEKFMKKHDNIVLINQENAGVAVARNVGVAAATGDYIMFVDSDDFIRENMVEKMVEEMIRTKADGVRCNVDTTLAFLQFCKIKENKVFSGKEYQEYVVRQLFEDNNIFCLVCNGIYKKELCGVFPKGFRLGEDVLFNGEYFLKAKSVAMITDDLYYYRDNPVSVTHKPNIKTILNNLDHFNSYYYVNDLIKNMSDKELKKDILDKVIVRNYATYLRLMFQVYGVANVFSSIKYSKNYYKMYRELYNKVEYDDIISIVVDSYHWPDYKVKSCVSPFYERHFLRAYIGYKYIYKGLKKRKNKA